MSQPAYTKVKVHGLSHTGQVRKENQDSFLIMVPANQKLLETKGILLSVADGMGGHAAGKEASSLALDTLVRHYYAAPAESQKDCLLSAITKAHQKIRMEAEASFDKRDMGTTLTSIVIFQNRAWIANVGDSRTYRIRDGKISQMTVDHSVTNELGLVGEDARNSAYRNQITRAVGVGRDVQADLFVEPLQEDDIYVLCSDGLTRHVSDKEILQIAGKKNPEKAAQQLIQMTNKRGAEDNVTVIVARAEKIANPPAAGSSTQTLNKRDLGLNGKKSTGSHFWMYLFFFSLLVYLISLVFLFRDEINARDPKYDQIKNVLGDWRDATDELQKIIAKKNIPGEKAINDASYISSVDSVYSEAKVLLVSMKQNISRIQLLESKAEVAKVNAMEQDEKQNSPGSDKRIVLLKSGRSDTKNLGQKPGPGSDKKSGQSITETDKTTGNEKGAQTDNQTSGAEVWNSDKQILGQPAATDTDLTGQQTGTITDGAKPDASPDQVHQTDAEKKAGDKPEEPLNKTE